MADIEATSYKLLTDVTTAIASADASLGSDNKAVQVKGVTTSGTGAATVLVEVSNDTAWPWLTAGTLTLTLSTTPSVEGIVLFAGWKYVRVRVQSISGTGAKISANVGV